MKTISIKFNLLLFSVLMMIFSCTDPNQNPADPDDSGNQETPSEPQKPEEDIPEISYIVNGDMEEEVSMDLVKEAVAGSWSYIGGWNNENATVKYEVGKGVKASNCISIMSLNKDVDVMFAQKVTGLTPGGYYKAKAKVKTDAISGGKGANMCLDYLWAPSSDGRLGSTHNKWENMEFDVDDVPESGEIVLCLRLGNTAASSTGLVYWDDVKLVENQDLYIRSSKHLRLVVDKKYVTISDAAVDAWLANLDKVYEAYEELFSGMVPFDGKITTIRAATIGAWAFAGNPIQWNRDYIADALSTVARGDWCFGLMHEIGHNFAPYMNNGTYTFDFNEELFANFRMFYALEKLNATVITTASVPQEDGSYVSKEKTYVGAELLELYKSETTNCFDRTVAAGKAEEMGNALCYMLIKIKEKYGWELYQKAFLDLYNRPRNQEEEKTMNHWERLEYFLDCLNVHAREITGKPAENVRNCFSTPQWNTVKAYLSTQKDQ